MSLTSRSWTSRSDAFIQVNTWSSLRKKRIKGSIAKAIVVLMVEAEGRREAEGSQKGVKRLAAACWVFPRPA